MTLSRTARILIALLLVAAAAFVWINFFAETPDTPPLAGPTVEAPQAFNRVVSDFLKGT